MKKTLLEIEEAIIEAEKTEEDSMNKILLNKIKKEVNELKEKETQITVKGGIYEIKEKKEKIKDFEEKTILYVKKEKEEIQGIFLTKREKKETNFDTLYIFEDYRGIGLGKELVKVAYERRETEKVYSYPIADAAKKIMLNMGFFELDDKEDYVWVNKENFK